MSGCSGIGEQARLKLLRAGIACGENNNGGGKRSPKKLVRKHKGTRSPASGYRNERQHVERDLLGPAGPIRKARGDQHPRAGSGQQFGDRLRARHIVVYEQPGRAPLGEAGAGKAASAGFGSASLAGASSNILIKRSNNKEWPRRR